MLQSAARYVVECKGETLIQWIKKPQTLIERMGFQDRELSTPQHDTLMLWLDRHLEEIINRVFPLPQSNDREPTNEELTEWARNRADLRLDESLKERPLGIEPYVPFRDTNEYPNHAAFYEADKKQQRQYKEAINDRLEELIACERASFDFSLIDRRWTIEKKCWERPIMAGRNSSYIVGFIDLEVTAVAPYRRILKRGRREDMPVGFGYIYKSLSIAFEAKPTIRSAGELLRQLRTYKQYLVDDYDMYANRCERIIAVVSPDDRFAPLIESEGFRFVKAELRNDKLSDPATTS